MAMNEYGITRLSPGVPLTKEDYNALSALASCLAGRSIQLSHELLTGLTTLPRVMVVARDMATGEIVGTASLIFTTGLTLRPRARVEDVVVAPAHRMRKLGKALVRAVENVARERGVAELRLSSKPLRKSAQALYRKLGYEPHTSTNHFVKHLGAS